ncbi:MAG: BON domain-containing protein [Candidatus Sericytochromatia bacterium]
MKLGTLLTGLGLGAGLMYLLDPERGDRRRATLLEQATHVRTHGVGTVSKRSRHLRNRAVGLLAEARRRTRHEEVSDDVLVARVRSKMGLVVSKPRQIEVAADKGRVILSGPIPTGEVDRLLQTVSNIAGVEIVENWLEEHEEAEESEVR